MEENFSMEWNMEWKWKKIASMEYGKIVFHSIPCPAHHLSLNNLEKPNFFSVTIRNSHHIENQIKIIWCILLGTNYKTDTLNFCGFLQKRI